MWVIKPSVRALAQGAGKLQHFFLEKWQSLRKACTAHVASQQNCHERPLILSSQPIGHFVLSL
jgi:hypothetical protein